MISQIHKEIKGSAKFLGIDECEKCGVTAKAYVGFTGRARVIDLRTLTEQGKMCKHIWQPTENLHQNLDSE